MRPASGHHLGGRRRRAIGIDLQGGKGNASNFPHVAPTLCAISHGTPNAALIYAYVPPFPRRPDRGGWTLRRKQS